MKLFFPLKDTGAVIQALNHFLGGRKLGEIVKLSQSGNDLVVTFSKLGTSTMTFACTARDKGLEFNLTSEKIALTHRAMKDEVKSKLGHVVEQAGGKML